MKFTDDYKAGSTRLPWRVQCGEDGNWQVWTRQDDTPGTLNNYVVAEGIQTEHEAIAIAALPELVEALAEAIGSADEILSSNLPPLIKASFGARFNVEKARAALAKAGI